MPYNQQSTKQRLLLMIFTFILAFVMPLIGAVLDYASAADKHSVTLEKSFGQNLNIDSGIFLAILIFQVFLLTHSVFKEFYKYKFLKDVNV